MAGMSTTAANALLNTWGSTYHWVSLHTADPGTTGANEVNTSGYVRQSITWPAAASSQMVWTGSISFTISSALTVVYWGLWSASTSGTWGDGQVLGVARTFGSAATLTLTRLPVALIG
jgi:hypothetical protein